MSVVKNQTTEVKAAIIKKQNYYIALAIILLLSLIVYYPVLHNGLLDWDDNFYIKNNPLIYSINLKEIFSRYVMGNYHPLTILTLAIEYHFFGLNETGYHTVNLLLHLLNVVIVFYVVFLLSDKAGVALVAAMLFGVHPMHVESVAWAAELKDLLYAFFFLLSYFFYLRYLKGQNKKWYFFALLLFLFSLLSKAMAVSLPVVLILTDYFKGRKVNIKTLMEKAPFFLLAIVFGIVAIMAQKSYRATEMVDFSFQQRIVFACFGFISYLYKLLMPLHLSAFYPYPIKSGGIIPTQYYTYLILLACVIAIVFYSRLHTKKIIFGVGFFTITVFLVLQLYPVGATIMADRYSYIPSIGIFYLAGEGFYLLWRKNQKWIAIILFSVFAVFYSVKTYARCGVWKNNMTLWDDVINQYPSVPQAYYNRGIVFMNENKYNQALDDFNKAIELDPNKVKAYNNRGIIFYNQNKYNQALDDYNKALELDSNQVEIYINRGFLFNNEKKYDQALNDFNKAIQLDPNKVEAYINRGIVFINEKKYDQALNDYNKAIELDANNAQAYYNKGNVYFNEKKYDEAIINYSKAIGLRNDFFKAYYGRGLAKYYSGKKDAACEDLKQAADLGYKPAAEVVRQICN